MELATCLYCKKFFNHIGGLKICPMCKEILESKFQYVKEYIQENPHANIYKVAEDCEVPLSQIQKWIDEQRLELVTNQTIIYCVHCNKPIYAGKMCIDCQYKIAKGLHELIHDNTTKTQNDIANHAKMRYQRER